jgi:uncharacterized membrane protein
MTTDGFAHARPSRAVSLAPTRVDHALALGATLILVAVAAAVGRGHAEWALIPWPVWVHLATMAGALILTPLMLLRRRGDRLHRRLGRVWVALMIATALISFAIRGQPSGALSPIHLISAFVLVMAPYGAWRASRHDIRAHRMAIRMMITGALLIAGLLTFPFGRLLGRWLFG